MKEKLTQAVHYLLSRVKELARTEKEVDIVFIMIVPTEWLAYVKDMPAVNGTGSSAGEALRNVLRELTYLGECTGQSYVPKVQKISYVKVNWDKGEAPKFVLAT